ncbi:MAG: hypothetical protein ACK5QC_15730 [Bacteroidota bacterium]|jgi:hypothetical protein|nr:hypothetical protein [Bacteroidota bacterium]MCA6443648.1 hypothetical protein [Bacteroidota bacterium]
MKIIHCLLFVPAFVAISCNKTYTCECTNATVKYVAGEVEGTKKKAAAKCEELNTSNTTCNIK